MSASEIKTSENDRPDKPPNVIIHDEVEEVLTALYESRPPVAPKDWYQHLADISGLSRTDAKFCALGWIRDKYGFRAWLVLAAWKNGGLSESPVNLAEHEPMFHRSISQKCPCGVEKVFRLFRGASDAYMTQLFTDVLKQEGWHTINEDLVCGGCAKYYRDVTGAWE